MPHYRMFTPCQNRATISARSGVRSANINIQNTKDLPCLTLGDNSVKLRKTLMLAVSSSVQ
eukprot:scaffold223695_cov19-Prasinocladus_malaysianus.AAC.1